MTPVSRFAILAMLPLLAGAADSKVATWPMFRGPGSAGVGAGKPPVHFSPDRGVLWRTPIGA
jgi:hypothetical protein